MLRDSVLRRTPVKLALAVAATVVAAYLIAITLAYVLMRDELTKRQDQRISEIFALLSANSDQGGDSDLAEAVRTQIAAARDSSMLFALRGADGGVLAANVPAITLPLGWSDQPPGVFGRPGDVPYRVLVGTVGADQLLIGIDYTDLDALRETIQAAMIWSSVFALIAALGGGTLIATRVQRRLAEVENTMRRVADGDLSARLPLTAGDDDIDRVSGQVNTALERLSGLVEGMRQVSSDIAHDLRTPLNRLRMQLTEAADLTERGRDARPALAAAMAESDAISGTFSALLRIAQIEAGARRERFTSVDLRAVLTSVTEVYTDVAEDAGMTLQSQIPPAEAWISGDAELLTQCFANLIENAIRHCPKGSHIFCALRITDGRVTATVTDNGPGIPHDEREKVLRRLYRLERSLTTSGSGLGLSLVKAVADLHGATLLLGDAGPGLVVHLDFPARPSA